MEYEASVTAAEPAQQANTNANTRPAGTGAGTRLVRIDFRQIAGLPARDFYRILALAVIKEIAKCPQVKNALNMPLPSTCKEFRAFLSQLDENVSGRIMLLLSETELLSEAQIRKLRRIIGTPQKGNRLAGVISGPAASTEEIKN